MTTARPVVLAALVTCAGAFGCGGSDSALLTGDVVVTMTMSSLPAQLPINTTTTGVYFRTVHYDDVAGTQYYDYVPARSTFQDLSASGQATDPSDDVADINGNGSSLFPWVDFTEVTVSLR